MFLARLRIASRCSSNGVLRSTYRSTLKSNIRLSGLNARYSTNPANFNDNNSYERLNKRRNELMGITVAAVITLGAVLYILPSKKNNKKASDEVIIQVTEVTNSDDGSNSPLIETPAVAEIEVDEPLAVPELEVAQNISSDDLDKDLIDIGESVVAEIVSDSVTGGQLETVTKITSPDHGSAVATIVEEAVDTENVNVDNDKSALELQAFEEEKLGETEEEAQHEGAVNPDTGEINWDCACLGGMAYGPCGEEFKEAFACFVYSEAEPKGIDCVEKFQAMQTCFRRYPDYYAEQLKDEDDATAEETDKTKTDASAPPAQSAQPENSSSESSEA
ncbi:hypothetical protein TPHA_0B01850 [Tetrapisispora phaffii CBS 4417]|uniref:Mitochondrial intermembrane space import and assembly protein 40 n=1 Tax=Tetrapisispora phaffii (strain ATCC 24235 / CBS 4417 / NBRC 1672 / NRRL Y-8282 / UCD 70-5) TaxID=1071381 RepID=G8BPC6_TETPH|nr:hypothetical protein TPHA_0B01850 [Tetrapisispora phaffii CBS 4417]CCE61857.1 hypothetical protein TPHA_0B01850 [Tetrapisispora phaffii CBS 4417]